MARPGSTWRLLILLSLVHLVVIPVALAGPASGLPIDQPLDQPLDQPRDRLGGVREAANEVVGGVKDQANDALGGVREAANEVVGPVVRVVGDAGPGPSGPSGNEEASDPVPAAGHVSEEAQGEVDRPSAMAASDEGDVDELARGGNEIVSPGHGVESGVGLRVPSPGFGGINPPISFTGWDLVIALLASFLLTTMGLALLSADARRGGPTGAPHLLALRLTGREIAVAGD
jgi:hypothetical protein